MDVVLFLYLLVTWHVECHLFILTKILKMESFPYKESVAMMGKICVTWYPVKHWGAFYLGSVYFPLLLNVFTSSAVFCIVEVFLYFSSCQFCLIVHFCDIVLCLVLAIRHDSFVYLYIAVSIWMYCFIITCMYVSLLFGLFWFHQERQLWRSHGSMQNPEWCISGAI